MAQYLSPSVCMEEVFSPPRRSRPPTTCSSDPTTGRLGVRRRSVLLAYGLAYVVRQRPMPSDGGGVSVGAADRHEERKANDVVGGVKQRSVAPAHGDVEHEEGKVPEATHRRRR